MRRAPVHCVAGDGHVTAGMGSGSDFNCWPVSGREPGEGPVGYANFRTVISSVSRSRIGAYPASGSMLTDFWKSV